MIIAIMIIICTSTGVYARKPPGFSLKTLDGDTYTLADDLGESVILLEFWGLCCRARLSEMKALENLYVQYGDKGLKVYAVNIDDASALSKVRPALKRYGYSFPVLLDPAQEVFRKYSPAGKKPYTVIIGKNGEIVEAIPGEDPDARNRVDQCIQNLMN